MLAYLFDMDGTLVDNAAYHVLSWREYARRELHLEVSEKTVTDLLGRTTAGYLEALLGRAPTPEEVRETVAGKERIYRELYRPHVRPVAGLLGLLERAKAANIPCAVATGGPRENIDFILDTLGIRPYFSALLGDTDAPRGKPAPDIYLAAAKALGADPRDCVVFEDGLPGIASGKAAGCKVVAVTTTFTADALRAFTPAPDLIVGSFDEVRL